jgi:uncharacterized membrane protein
MTCRVRPSVAERVAGRERGTVLMLMPAAVLVLLMLGGIAFDYAHLYLAKRELSSLAEGAANNAASDGVDEAAVRRGDGYLLDPDLVARSVLASIAARPADLQLVGEPTVELLSPTTVQVTITARIQYVFTKAVPGARTSETVTVRAVAEARSS